MSKKYVFHGDTYEEHNNVDSKLLSTSDVNGGDNIDVNIANDGKSATIASTLPFSVVNGTLMVTYEVETDNEEE